MVNLALLDVFVWDPCNCIALLSFQLCCEAHCWMMFLVVVCWLNMIWMLAICLVKVNFVGGDGDFVMFTLSCVWRWRFDLEASIFGFTVLLFHKLVVVFGAWNKGCRIWYLLDNTVHPNNFFYSFIALMSPFGMPFNFLVYMGWRHANSCLVDYLFNWYLVRLIVPTQFLDGWKFFDWLLFILFLECWWILGRPIKHLLQFLLMHLGCLFASPLCDNISALCSFSYLSTLLSLYPLWMVVILVLGFCPWWLSLVVLLSWMVKCCCASVQGWLSIIFFLLWFCIENSWWLSVVPFMALWLFTSTGWWLSVALLLLPPSG